MEVVVQDARGAPEFAHVAIRLGEMRRQMQLKAGGHFRFDAAATKVAEGGAANLADHFSLQVFQEVGSVQVRWQDLAPILDNVKGGAPTRRGVVAVPLLSGAAMEVNLQVKASPTSAASAAKTSPRGSSKSSPKAIHPSVSPKTSPKNALPAGPMSPTQLRKAQATDYLRCHAIEGLLQGLVHKLLEVRPTQPLDFMLQYLQHHKVLRQQAAAAQHPASPAAGTGEAPSTLRKRQQEEKERQEREVREREEAKQKEETKQKEEKEKKEKEQREWRERELREKREQQLRQKREQELKETWERELRQKWEQELRERVERELQERQQRELKEKEERERRERQQRELKEKEEREERELKEQQEQERKQREEQERREKEEQELKERQERELKEQEVRERKAKEDRDFKERQEQDLKEQEEREQKEKAEQELKEQEDRRLREQEEQELQEIAVKQEQEQELQQHQDQELNKQVQKQEEEQTQEQERELERQEDSQQHQVQGQNQDPDQNRDGEKDLREEQGLESHNGEDLQHQEEHQQEKEQEQQEQEQQQQQSYNDKEEKKGFHEEQLTGSSLALRDTEATGDGDEQSDEDESWQDDAADFPFDHCPEDLPGLYDHHSVACRVLAEKPELYHNFKHKRTSLGSTLAPCIKPGIDTPGCVFFNTLGLVAADAECYEVFRELFDEVLLTRTLRVDPRRARHHNDSSYFKLTNTPLDPSGKFVLKVRVACARSLSGFRMPPSCSSEERLAVEELIVKNLTSLSASEGSKWVGEYHRALGDGDHEAPGPRFAPLEPDAPTDVACGFSRDWPEGRGCWAATKEEGLSELSALVNVREHLQLEVQRSNADLSAAFRDAFDALAALSGGLKEVGHDFAHSPRLGFLNCKVTSIGAGLSLGVTVKLPKLAQHKSKLDEVCETLGVHCTLMLSHDSNRKTVFSPGVFEIMNIDSFQHTEVELFNVLVASVRALIDMEQRLSAGEEINFSREPEASLARLQRGLVVAETDREELDASDLERAHTAAAAALGEDEDRCDDLGFPTESCPKEMPSLENHHSWMAEALRADPSLYNDLRTSETQRGVRLSQCLKPGFDNPGHPALQSFGLIAGDAQSYDTFGPLFDAVLEAAKVGGAAGCAGGATGWHRGSSLSGLRTANLSLDTSVRGARLELRRNLSSLRFSGSMSMDERLEAELMLRTCFEELEGELAGEYYSLAGLAPEEERYLESEGVLMNAPDSDPAVSSGLARDWPTGRGIYLANSKKLGAWINEEDHLRLWTKATNNDLRGSLELLFRLEDLLSSALAQRGHSFAWSSKYGYLTSCPGHSGSGLQLEACADLPHVSSHQDFRELCGGLHLQPRLLAAAASSKSGSSPQYELSLSSFLNVSSTQEQVCTFVNSIQSLLGIEARLAAGETIDLSSLVPSPTNSPQH